MRKKFTHISIDTFESVLVDQNQNLKVKIFDCLKKKKERRYHLYVIC